MSINDRIQGDIPLISDHAPNIGIASRLVNQESKYTNRGPTTLLPQLLNSPTPYRYQNSQDFGRFVGFPDGYPLYGQPGTFVLPHGFAQVALHTGEIGYGFGDPRSSSTSFFRPQYVSVGQDFRTKGAFQYPLHHLTCFPDTSPFSTSSVVVRPQFVAANGFERRVLETRPLCTVRNPSSGDSSGHVLPIAKQPDSNNTPDQSASSSVRPAFIFEDYDGDLPHDLSIRKLEKISEDSNNETALEHSGISNGLDSLINELENVVSVGKLSKIEEICDEWRLYNPVGEADCWDFVQEFNQRKKTLDFLNIHLRSTISQLPERYRTIICRSPVDKIPEKLLQKFELKRVLLEDQANQEILLEAEDVDHRKLSLFVQDLIKRNETNPDLPSGGERDLELLSAVGLIPVMKTTQPLQEPTVKSRGRRKRKLLTHQAETSDCELPHGSVSVRATLIEQLDSASSRLISEIRKLKEQQKVIKSIKEKEKICSDEEIPALLTNLKNLLQNQL